MKTIKILLHSIFIVQICLNTAIEPKIEKIIEKKIVKEISVEVNTKYIDSDIIIDHHPYSLYLQEKTANGLNEIQGGINENFSLNGCVVQNSKAQNWQQSIQKFSQNGQEYVKQGNSLQDILVIEELQKAYVFSNITYKRQLEVYQLDFIYDTNSTNLYQSIQNSTVLYGEKEGVFLFQINTNTHPLEPQQVLFESVHVIQYQSIPFIFTYYGVYTFDPYKNLPKQDKSIKPLPNTDNYFQMIQGIEFRYEITNVTLHDQYITVFYGNNGASIYQIDTVQKTLKYHLELNYNPVIIEFKHIRDIRCDKNHLYILHESRGLIIQDHQKNDLLTLPTENAQAFDVYENTLIIISESTEGQVIYEYYVDYKKLAYYLNQQQSFKGSQYNEVWVEKDIAVLVGDSSFKLIYHSVYNQFIDYNYMFQTTTHTASKTIQAQLVSRKNPNYQKNTAALFNDEALYNLVTVQPSSVTIFTLSIQKPTLFCASYFSIDSVYLLTYNSTCPGTKQNEYFTQCQGQREIHFKAYKPIFGTSRTKLIMIIMGAIVLTTILGIVLYYSVQYYKKRKQKKLTQQELEILYHQKREKTVDISSNISNNQIEIPQSEKRTNKNSVQINLEEDSTKTAENEFGM